MLPVNYNFTGLVLSCIEADFRDQILLESSRRKLHNTLRSTTLRFQDNIISMFWFDILMIRNVFVNLTKIEMNLFIFQNVSYETLPEDSTNKS